MWGIIPRVSRVFAVNGLDGARAYLEVPVAGGLTKRNLSFFMWPRFQCLFVYFKYTFSGKYRYTATTGISKQNTQILSDWCGQTLSRAPRYGSGPKCVLDDAYILEKSQIIAIAFRCKEKSQGFPGRKNRCEFFTCIRELQSALPLG